MSMPVYEVSGSVAYQIIKRSNNPEPFKRIMIPGALQKSVLLYSNASKATTITGEKLLHWLQSQPELYEASKRLKEAVSR